MADGSTRPIEEVEEGDEILADDPLDAEGIGAHRVVQIHRTATYRLFHVEVRGADGGEIVATGGHPFWTERGGRRRRSSPPTMFYRTITSGPWRSAPSVSSLAMRRPST